MLGACRGVVFRGAIAQTLIAPGDTPTLGGKESRISLLRGDFEKVAVFSGTKGYKPREVGVSCRTTTFFQKLPLFFVSI